MTNNWVSNTKRKSDSFDENKIPLLIITGPTAVGKSRIAIEIARRTGGEIITADSAQVYRGLNIGTAKPSLEEQMLVKHHLIDIVEPNSQFSVAEYQKIADTTIADVFSRKSLPILTGGTGLYIQSVIDRYVFTSKGRDMNIRNSLEKEAKSKGANVLYERLMKVDGDAAQRIHPRNLRRIIRALEVYYTEGLPISRQLEETGRRYNPYNLCLIGLEMSRDKLYQRIEERVDSMIKEGFMEEVNILMKVYSPEEPGMQVLGYKQLTRCILGDITLDDAVLSIKHETRRLAKKQYTWFRRDKRINWLDVTDVTSKKMVEKLCDILMDKMQENWYTLENNIYR